MTGHTAPLPRGCSPSGFRHGFSTHWIDVDRDDAGWFVEILTNAIGVGYRRFDCSPLWDTEAVLGTAVDRAAVGRDELFVTTVVPYGRLGERGTRESIHASLERLGLDHLDAVFVSAPLPGWDVAGTAAALNSLVESGLVTHVGARYMSLADVGSFMDHLATPMFGHLTELHPLWPAGELRAHAVEHGYWVVADSPMMQGVVGEIREIRRAASRSGGSPFQVTLAWLHGLANVATSTWVHDPVRMAENLRADEIDLDPDTVAEIGAITRRWSGAPNLHPVSPG